MKVTLPKDYKRIYTVEEHEQAKAVIASEKEDSFTAKDYAEMALHVLCSKYGWTEGDVILATAETCKNPRIRTCDLYGVGTGFMDIVIHGTANIWGTFENDFGRAYIEIYANLSDIWQAGDPEAFNSSHIACTLFTHHKF